ncbi:uncharacterized protein FPRO_04962 [Fusarium proliferatum ET1]|uniref:Ras modification protein ERF4 n=1 Tax=Fusarium proliferatum (strain ET1) TaxID=1227346 RepID=A0A1L7VHH1_FUSPR|nr:uncharacterized protein FPRO_04962 [Fusarium proliferatum ET1]CZR40063.1 uncharacterized protein FPRO_04962 [Fusarium proliferatum ET1]
MLASRASSSPSSTKPPVNLSPAPFRSRHWPTVSEFPLVDVCSLYCFFSCSLSPLPVNDSSNSLARCRSTNHYYEIEADTVHDGVFTDATAFNTPFSLSAPDLSLATAATRSCRIPSFSFSAFVFRQHWLRAQAISAQPHSPGRSQQREKDLAISSERGRPGGRADNLFPTDPHLARPSPSNPIPAAVDAPGNPLILSLEPPRSAYPGTGSSSGQAAAAAAAASNIQRQPARPFDGYQATTSHPSPFRPQKAAGVANRPRRLSAVRLWNPTNSTPRPHTKPESSRKRRPSTPPPPSIPLKHPTFDTRAPTDPIGSGPSDYPLLTLSEQHQIRHSLTPRASLQVDRAGSSDRRISLPNSVRASYDEKGSRRGEVSAEEPRLSRDLFAQEPVAEDPIVKIDKGKGKAVMMPETDDPMPSYGKDLERGPDIMDPRISNVSAGDGIGSALSTTNSSIMGEDVEPDAAGEWGPQHPCYPHLNPHVPVDSPEYVNTRIIRIRRDWLIKGDLAPTFSNLYPEILDPAGLSEQEFRRIIEKLNGELIPAFDPYGLRNIIDTLLGLVTGWIWDDVGLTGVKSRLNSLEKWIEQWNLEMEKTIGTEDGAIPPKILPLRQTGYMTLDIQIPDPEIAPAPSTTNPNDSRTALPLEPPSTVV